MNGQWRVSIAWLVFTSTVNAAPSSLPSVEIGGRQWALKMRSADEALLAELKSLPVVTWCFESLQGRGLLKDLNLHLSWMEDVPQLSFSKDVLTSSAEDKIILSCLDATLKDRPPAISHAEREINFQYTLKRRR